jgi:hypothetical protein
MSDKVKEAIAAREAAKAPKKSKPKTAKKEHE